MACTPTELVSEHLAGDPALLREARQRLTLADYPVDLRDHVADLVRRPAPRGYAVRRNERIIRAHGHLGALRLALVQWAAQHAPREIGGYHGLLSWALGHVDLPVVIAGIAASPYAPPVPARLAPRNERVRAWRRAVRWEPASSMQ